MREQNFKNHAQVVYSYYLLVGIPILVLIGLGIRKHFTGSYSEGEIGAVMILIGWICIGLMFRSRGFAIIAQDRAIRAEEAFRHYILTGKALDSRLTLKQIIALRFASDAELPALAQRAISENLKPNAIKQAIKHWRADIYRV